MTAEELTPGQAREVVARGELLANSVGVGIVFDGFGYGREIERRKGWREGLKEGVKKVRRSEG